MAHMEAILRKRRRARIMSTVDLIKERWEDVKEAVKARFEPKITDEDLAEILPDHDVLCDLIGSRCDVSKQKADQEVRKILDQMRPFGLG
jgi:hypothetical protein